MRNIFFPHYLSGEPKKAATGQRMNRQSLHVKQVAAHTKETPKQTKHKIDNKTRRPQQTTKSSSNRQITIRQATAAHDTLTE